MSTKWLRLYQAGVTLFTLTVATFLTLILFWPEETTRRSFLVARVVLPVLMPVLANLALAVMSLFVWAIAFMVIWEISRIGDKKENAK